MIGRMMRISPDLFCRILFSAILSILVTGTINIDQIFYKQEAKSVSQMKRIGYPAEAQTKRVNSIQEINANRTFTIELSKQALKPTGIYKRIGQNYHSRSKLGVWMERFDGIAYGQYYIAELATGEKVVVFLDTQAISLTSKTAPLPIGETKSRVVREYFNEWKEQYQIDEESWYVDMAGTVWRQSKIAGQIRWYRNGLWVIAAVGSYLILTRIFAAMGWLPDKR